MSQNLEQIRMNLEKQDSDTLLENWTNNDKSIYSEDTFDIMQSILENRGIALQVQKQYVKPTMTEKEKSTSIKILYTILLLFLAIGWWIGLQIFEISNLGPGFTLGHIVQMLIILLIIAFPIRKVWKKK